jgi:hypothetical protein
LIFAQVFEQATSFLRQVADITGLASPGDGKPTNTARVKTSAEKLAARPPNLLTLRIVGTGNLHLWYQRFRSKQPLLLTFLVRAPPPPIG